MSGPIGALAAASPRRKVNIFGRRASGPCGGRKQGPQGRNSLALRERGTIIRISNQECPLRKGILDSSWHMYKQGRSQGFSNSEILGGLRLQLRDFSLILNFGEVLDR